MKFNIFKINKSDELVLVARATSVERAIRHARHLSASRYGWLKELGGHITVLPIDHKWTDENTLIYAQFDTHFVCREDTPLRIDSKGI